MADDRMHRIQEGYPFPRGANWDENGTNFSVVSSAAEAVEVCLFDGESQTRLELPGCTDGVYHGYVPGVTLGTRYGFRVHGPWDPGRGQIFCPQKLLLDPCAKAVSGTVCWDPALFVYDRNNPDKPADTQDSAHLMPKCVVVEPMDKSQAEPRPEIPWQETVLYEIHPRGFTIQHPDIPEEIRGTYAGLAHPASVEYIKDLGVTSVELLPVAQFVHRKWLIDMGMKNYWGYDPVCFMAPQNEYASTTDPGAMVREFRNMVRTFHEAGLEVILDVVFNHTAEGGTDGAYLIYKGIDNAAYYRIAQGRHGLEYTDWTGTQNTFNCESPAARELIITSLRYWVREMNVDGFRFDLAPALFRRDSEVRMDTPLMKSILDDPDVGRVKLIAEPWDLGDGGYRLGGFPAPWREWNGRFRDQVRNFWRGRSTPGEFCARIGGSPDVFDPHKRPHASINFITSHDGFTLHDLVTYERKHNAKNGLYNRDGDPENYSWNCGAEGETSDSGINRLRAVQKHNLLTTLFFSGGIVTLLGGDETGRTQQGNNNPFCQDNTISWVNWQQPDMELKDFVKQLVHLRKRYAGLFAHRMYLSCLNPEGTPLSDDRINNAATSSFQLDIVPAEEHVSADGEVFARQCLRFLINRSQEDREFQVPQTQSGAGWTLLCDTDRVDSEETSLSAGSLLISAGSMVVLGEMK